MAVIKHAQRESLARQAVVLDLGDLQRAAEALEARTRERARAILDEAARERERLIAGAAERGHSEGREVGFARGVEEGRERGAAEALAARGEVIRSVTEAWAGALREFEQRREDLLLEAREGVLGLAAAIAERVVKRAIELDPSVVREQLSVALGRVVGESKVRVATHPEDLGAARAVLPGLVERMTSGVHASVEADESLARGSVVLRTPRGEVDASIATQLDRLVEVLLPGGASPAERAS